MGLRFLTIFLIGALIAFNAQTARAQSGIQSATSAKQAHSSSEKQLGSDDTTYKFSDNIAALMVTLVFFGLFAIFYIKLRNAPSEHELKKNRKKHKL